MYLFTCFDKMLICLTWHCCRLLATMKQTLLLKCWVYSVFHVWVEMIIHRKNNSELFPRALLCYIARKITDSCIQFTQTIWAFFFFLFTQGAFSLTSGVNLTTLELFSVNFLLIPGVLLSTPYVFFMISELFPSPPGVFFVLLSSLA